MKKNYLKPNLSKDQKEQLKELYVRNNYSSWLSIFQDVFWIGFAYYISAKISYLLYPLSLIIIGTRQRALATLFHDAAHETLFLSKFLNVNLGRLICGWPILQSYHAYKASHVIDHHSKISDPDDDPDFKYMKEQGVYDSQSRKHFLQKFIIFPLLGSLTLKYIVFLFRDRFFSYQKKEQRNEIISMLLFHVIIFMLFLFFDMGFALLLFWWIPFLIVHPVIGWFSELAEHYPFMINNGEEPIFYSRNRYANCFEKLFIGMHGDYLHLTHHLYPRVPHYNLEKATKILRNDPVFSSWDNKWGGIFTSDSPDKNSLLKYILNVHKFKDNKDE